MTTKPWIALMIYLAVINLLAFALMGIDKNRAKMHRWRISETALFLSALVGGSVGAMLGMWSFRHKTRHWYFVVGMPMIFLVQALACLWLARNVYGFIP